MKPVKYSLICLLLIICSVAWAEEELPSLELLEFLAEMESDENNGWQDVLQTMLDGETSTDTEVKEND
jgi:hypothetical protein